MKFEELPLKDSYIINLEERSDDRGFFSRFFCKKEFEEYNLDTNIVQANNSLSKYKGTIRGIHFQLKPKAETKIVRCIRGSLWDVILDLRKNSPTFGKWHGETLTAENRKMMYVPKGFGHAYISLEDNVEILYLVSEFYAPEYERIVRWNDLKFNIQWPIEPVIISDKDRNSPDFNENYHLKSGRSK